MDTWMAAKFGVGLATFSGAVCLVEFAQEVVQQGCFG